MNKKLRSLIDRAERLIAEREEVNDAMKDLRAECKGQQYDAAQIMRLAQLSHDDKKRAKLAESNEVLALYNRESGLGLVLGLDDNTEPDRAATSSAPAGKEPDRAKPAPPDPIPQSPAGVAPHATDSDPVAACGLSPRAVPAGDADEGWQAKDSAGNYQVALAVLAERAKAARAVDELVAMGQAMGGYDPPGYVPPPDIAAERHSVLTRHVSTDTPDLSRMSESELVERAMAAKPAQPWRAA